MGYENNASEEFKSDELKTRNEVYVALLRIKNLVGHAHGRDLSGGGDAILSDAANHLMKLVD